MRKKFKIIIAVFVLIAMLVLFICLFSIYKRSPNILSYLPEPPEMKGYVLVETREQSFPSKLSAFLTDGSFAVLHRGSSRNALLSLASKAKAAAVLIVNEDLTYAEIYAVYKLQAKDTANLRRGELPEEWLQLLPSARVEKGEKGCGKIWSMSMDAPIYYYLDKDKVVLAADEKPFAELLQLWSAKNKKAHVWRQEKGWPGHLEWGDGAVLLGDSAVKLQFAWRSLPRRDDNGRAGEAKWIISELKASHRAALLRLVKQVEWQNAEHVLPATPILVTGLNIPKFKSSPVDWPFPLSTVANLVGAFGLDQNIVRELMSGKTIFSLGGKNKLLWFTLPGLMVEFSGSEPALRKTVELFWSSFFLDSEPKKLDGWDYGGSITMPFSVVGVGRSNAALLGLVSPGSLRNGAWLTQYLPERERAIGWLVADLPKLGDSLSDMTRMMSLLTFEDGEDDGYISDEEEDVKDVPFRPGELDQGITDSFGRLLRSLGRVCVVWEQPESGRLSWYK